MKQHSQAISQATKMEGLGDKLGSLNWERTVTVYARVALGAAFLSAVSGRFGLWHGTFDMTYFSSFLKYAQQEVLAFMPSVTVSFLAWAATFCETTLGILLILGLWPRWVSFAAAVLLAIFGISMALSTGLESPMDYSVFSASSAAALLALHAFRENRN